MFSDDKTVMDTYHAIIYRASSLDAMRRDKRGTLSFARSSPRLRHVLVDWCGLSNYLLTT